jgi:hypothetical protein
MWILWSGMALASSLEDARSLSDQANLGADVVLASGSVGMAGLALAAGSLGGKVDRSAGNVGLVAAVGGLTVASGAAVYTAAQATRGALEADRGGLGTPLFPLLLTGVGAATTAWGGVEMVQARNQRGRNRAQIKLLVGLPLMAAGAVVQARALDEALDEGIDGRLPAAPVLVGAW